MILLKVVLVTVDPPTAETERADYSSAHSASTITDR